MKNKQNGFAILIVLVAVAIVMLLYFVQMGALFGPAGPSEPKGVEQHPWALEELLIPADEPVKLPRKPRPLLDQRRTVSGGVRLEEAERGNASVTFGTDGRVEARWQCEYEQTGATYQLDAAMQGNVVVKRTYVDDAGKDKSRLFFIARGAYTKTPADAAASAMAEKGQAWLTGWLAPDGSVTSHITITTNQQWAGVYSFAAPK